jgi:hypothetical protein
MPIVKTETGNLLEMFKQAQVPPLLAHGTNCLKTMRGISAELAEEFPVLTTVDEEFPLPALYRLGDYSAIGVECGTILNFYTSLEVEGNFEYSALKSCLKKLSMEAINAGTYIQLTFPQINQPGVSWDIVKKILNSQEQLLITVVQHDKREVRMGEGEAEQAS